MAHPIGECHEPAAEKCRPSCKQPDHDQRSADEFDRTCNRDHEGWNLRRRRGGNAQQFLSPMPEEKKPRHYSHERIGLGGIGMHELGHRVLLLLVGYRYRIRHSERGKTTGFNPGCQHASATMMPWPYLFKSW